MSNFVELEPTPSEESTTKGSNSTRHETNIKARQEDIRILEDVLNDVRFNELTKKYEYGSRSSPIVLEGDDIELLTVSLAVDHDVFIPEARIKAAFKFLARRNKYCPIKRYLLECAYRAEYFDKWDELGKYMLGSDMPVATQIMQRFLIGAVARAYNPGAAMQWMPIIIGEQGCGKSQLFHKLVPNDLFAEISLNIDIMIKEMYRLHVAWIIEFPEVDNYFNPRNIEDLKNVVSTSQDQVRFPYNPMSTRLDRRFVMAGTSNRSEFLVDPTGNRRFLPVEIPIGFETPWRDLPNIRHQLWATAIREYEKGTQYQFTSGEIAENHTYIQQFNISDPWEELIQRYLSTHDEVTAAEVLTNALQFSPQAASTRDSKRVASILQQFGWRKTITSRAGKSVRLWVKPMSMRKAPTQLSDF